MVTRVAVASWSEPIRSRAARIGLVGAVLLLLLAAGILLRVLLVVGWHPVFLGFPDSGPYLADSYLSPFWDPLRMVGYGEFLRLLRLIYPHLVAVAVVQNLLGLAGGLLMFDSVRRLGGPSGLGLLPAGVILLGGDEAFLEHSVLSEPVFIFLIVAGLYCAVRSHQSKIWWLALSGVLLGLATTVRELGIVLIPVIAVWAAVASPPRWRGRAARLAVPLLTGSVVVLGYAAIHHDYTGDWSLTTSGAYNLYGRAAPFADCRKFTPPPGTRALCQRIPPRRRPGADFYNFDPGSPAHRLFGGSAQFPPSTADIAKLDAFARAAILNQPLDYLHDVARDLVRFVAPSMYPQHSGNAPQEFIQRLTDPNVTGMVEYQIRGWYPTGIAGSSGALHAAQTWERVTRVQGPLMLVLLVLALLSPIVTRGRQRAGAALFLLTALALASAPVATVFYDIRYAVPAYPPLAAAAALGGWGIWLRLHARPRRHVDRSASGPSG